jgi:hypothetical protein
MLTLIAAGGALAEARPLREDIKASHKIVGGTELSPQFKYAG